MDIELITTHALLTELETRFDHMIFAGLKNHDEKIETECRRHKGNWRTCQGLAMGAILAMEQSRSDESEPLTDEDI